MLLGGLWLWLADGVEEDIVEALEAHLAFVRLVACAVINLHELVLSLQRVFMSLQENSGVTLAEKTVQALESTLLEKLVDVTLDGSLAIELALLSELDRGLDVLRHLLKHEQGLLVSPLINVVQSDEVPDLRRAQSLTELVLKRAERVK